MTKRPQILQTSLDFSLETLDFQEPVASHQRREQALKRWGDQIAAIGHWPQGERAVAVIGTRKPSEAQRQFARQCGMELARAGAVVVSGGALGIDAEALRGAMQAGGKVVAVLPRPPQQPYPSSHQELFRDLAAQGGCLIGLQLPEGPLPRWAFVKRNQLLVELVDAVAVVACGVPSGTLSAVLAALRAGLTVRARLWSGAEDASPGTQLLCDAGMDALPPPQELADWLATLQSPDKKRRSPILSAVQPQLAGLRGAAGSTARPQAAAKRAARGDMRGDVDGEPRGWQSYAGPQTPGIPEAAAPPAPLHGQEALLWASLAGFGPAGATLEPLAQAASLARGEAAALLLALALAGRVRQGKEGSYVAQ